MWGMWGMELLDVMDPKHLFESTVASILHHAPQQETLQQAEEAPIAELSVGRGLGDLGTVPGTGYRKQKTKGNQITKPSVSCKQHKIWELVTCRGELSASL